MVGLQLRAWLQASRLPSQSYIFFPLLLGQAIALTQVQTLDWTLFVLIQLFGVFVQLYIVFANDLADQEVDLGNVTFNTFSGGSRVLIEGQISLAAMGRAVQLMVALNVLIGLVLSLWFHRSLALLFVAVSLLLLWAYSYPPLRQSYRGGGEFLQMLGVAGVLPLFGYYVQHGGLNGFPWAIPLILFPNHLGCAISTAIPDYPSDKHYAKRTAAVRLGPVKARQWILLLNWFSIMLLLVYGEIPIAASLRIAALPAVANLLLTMVFTKVVPGTKELLHFVTVNVAGVIAMVVGLCIFFFF